MTIHVFIPSSVSLAYPRPIQKATHKTQTMIHARLSICAEYIPASQQQKGGPQ